MRSILFFYLIVLTILLCFFSSISRATDVLQSSSVSSAASTAPTVVPAPLVYNLTVGLWSKPDIPACKKSFTFSGDFVFLDACVSALKLYYAGYDVDIDTSNLISDARLKISQGEGSSRSFSTGDSWYITKNGSWVGGVGISMSFTPFNPHYQCPPPASPDYTDLSDSDGTPNPLGQFCAKGVNPCKDFKDGSVDVYINVHAAPTQVCFQGCKASVPISVSYGEPDAPPVFKSRSYTLTGESCTGADNGYIDPQSAQLSNDALEQANKAAKSKADAADSAAAAKTYDNQASAGLDTASAAERSAEAAAEAAKLKADADARVASQAPTDQQAQAQAQAAKSAQDAAQAAADAQAALSKAQTASQSKTITSQSARDAQAAADAAQAAADRAAVAARDAYQRTVSSGSSYDAAIATLTASAAGDAQAAADAAGRAAVAARNGQSALTGMMGGGSGGSGSGGSGSGSGTGDSEDPEGSDFCKNNPGSIACIELGAAPDADKGLTDTIDVSVTPASGWGSDNAECPQPVIIQGPAWAGDFTLDTEPLCRFLRMIRPVVIALAWLSAALIVMGFRRSGSDE